MRPVARGPAPQVYTKYGDAIDDLVARMGRYCSYCERRLPTSLAVEHMAPKKHHPSMELDWDNFLLGCTNCNSVKTDNDLNDDELVWPDRDNTLRAFDYRQGGFVRVSEAIDDAIRQRAENLAELVGLDRHPANGWPQPTKKDKRWLQREEIWTEAERCRDIYVAVDDKSAALKLLVCAAEGYGFFSVWFEVFSEHEEVRRALIDAFPGTPADCFDADATPIARPGGVI